MTFGELGERMHYDEFREWIALDEVVYSDDWLRHAELCTIISNIIEHRFKLEDFLPERRPSAAPPDDPDLAAKIEAWGRAHS